MDRGVQYPISGTGNVRPLTTPWNSIEIIKYLFIVLKTEREINFFFRQGLHQNIQVKIVG